MKEKRETNGSININGSIVDTTLRGDFKHEGIMDEEKAKNFLDEMETLLRKYAVSKIDLCWMPHF